jgi:Virus neck protein
MLNTYFNFQTATNEQHLVENLVIESIQIYGMDIQYIPKTLVDYDKIYGEDPQKAFNTIYTIESYFENIDGFMGDKNFLNQLGLNIDKQATFIIAKRRFDETLLDLNWQYYWNPLTTYNINDALYYKEGIVYISLINSNVGNEPDISPTSWKIMSQVRPYEGDLIYLPITHDIFEILFVEHEEVFYQLGKIYVWKLTCEKFRFSHEKIDTGNTDVDSLATELENDNSIINDPLADNTIINEKIETFLNLDPKAPF